MVIVLFLYGNPHDSSGRGIKISVLHLRRKSSKAILRRVGANVKVQINF